VSVSFRVVSAVLVERGEVQQNHADDDEYAQHGPDDADLSAMFRVK